MYLQFPQLFYTLREQCERITCENQPVGKPQEFRLIECKISSWNEREQETCNLNLRFWPAEHFAQSETNDIVCFLFFF